MGQKRQTQMRSSLDRLPLRRNRFKCLLFVALEKLCSNANSDFFCTFLIITIIEKLVQEIMFNVKYY